MNFDRFALMAKSVFPRIALLLIAVLPVVESSDKMFYTNVVLIFLLFASWVICAARVYNIDKTQFIKYMTDSPKDALLDIAISVVGLQIYYSTAPLSTVSFWWLILAIAVFELIAVLKKDFNNLPVEYYRAIFNHWVVQILFALQLICSAASLFGFFETSSDSVYLLILAVAYFIDLLLYKKGVYKTVVPVILILAQNVLVIF
ncbi:MAG: hypothetical protein IKA00_09795 [Prevotella sp.]|nr:hypothetical protein [Prevotella sp.]